MTKVSWRSSAIIWTACVVGWGVIFALTGLDEAFWVTMGCAVMVVAMLIMEDTNGY